MSRFDRYSRISPLERYRALERRAWGSLGFSLLALAGLACCGLWSPPAPRSAGQGNGLTGFWAEPESPAAAETSETPSRILPASIPAPELEIEKPIIDHPEPEPLPLQELDVAEDWPELDPQPNSILIPYSPILEETTPPAGRHKGKKESAHASHAITASSKGSAGDYTPPAYKSAPKPPYPPGLRQQRIEGSVRVRIAISVEGKPTDVSIITSSGHSEFDIAARQWILQRWSFTPALLKGSPVPATVTTSIHFVLD